MMSTSTTPRRTGFTLLELLVVIGIMGVVTTIGVKSFALLTSSWSESRALVELDDTADVAFEMIALDLADALSAELSGVSIKGIDSTSEGIGFNQAGNNDDRLVVPVQGVNSGSSLQIARSVQYKVERSGDRNKLIRTIGPLGNQSPANFRNDVIERADVLRFDVTYGTGDVNNPWATSWDSESHPKAVRVALTLADPNNHFRQISRKETYMVHVR
jgi:prepilin-type N-terminal cleavage/methylation domain-containing protein